MKTKLPEKWYCKVTLKNFEKADEWRKVVATSHRDNSLRVGNCILSKHLTDGSFFYNASTLGSEYDDYKELNTEEFERLVYNPLFLIRRENQVEVFVNDNNILLLL